MAASNHKPLRSHRHSPSVQIEGTRRIARNDRWNRLIDLVRTSTSFSDAGERRLALFVAESVAKRADDDFLNRHIAEAFPGHIRNTVASVRRRDPDEIKVGCAIPSEATHGYTMPIAVLESCLADQPFIVDTTKIALRRAGVDILGTLNMILPVERDDQGALVDIRADNPQASNESFSCHLLPASQVAGREEELRALVLKHLRASQRIVADFRQMRRQVRDSVSSLQFSAEANPGLAAEFSEVADFVEWLGNDNFIFMGAWRYDAAGELTLALGAGRREDGEKAPIESRPKTALAGTAAMASVLQTRIDADIHRDGRMVEVRIRLFDEDGVADGGLIFQGLFTYNAVMGAASVVPLLRQRLVRLCQAEDLVPQSHRMKLFTSFFSRLPLAYAFSASDGDIQTLINNTIDVDFGGGARLHFRVNARRTTADGFLLLLSERYGEELRERVQTELKASFQADYVGHRLLVGKTDTMIVHFLLQGRKRLEVPDPDALNDRVAALISPWLERLRRALSGAGASDTEVEQHCLIFGDCLPPEYRRRVEPEHLLEDLRLIESVHADGALQLAIRRDHRDLEKNTVRLLSYGTHDFALTDILPVIDNFGLRVLGEHTYELFDAAGRTTWFESYRISLDDGQGSALLDHAEAFKEGLRAVLDGRMNSSQMNRLMLSARLTWHQLQVIRGYLAYARQLGTNFPPNLVQHVLRSQPELTRTLVDCFNARFAPYIDAGDDHEVSARSPRRIARLHECRDRFFKQLAEVEDVVEDKVLRMFFNFIGATLRTNYFQRTDEPRGLSFKFACSEVEVMPEPRPLFEIFVYDPRVEGVHLRGGKVARGGLRWSDRIDDFRTEVLGLMQTQMVKNTLIVPVGSKGGFVLKGAVSPADRRRVADELYGVFIHALLDLTDNIVGDDVVYPEDVIVYDGPDPYLVVAADKGTAHLSDTANAIALGRGFWLGDAFASGGSKGYDHKEYGITAKGGWVCVQRLFREMGVDTQTDSFTAVGIGDMSGDVFGNGLLLSETIRMIGAFDHRNIVLDPSPDATSSFAERKRLFELPRSSWVDYDTSLLSPGGGVFPRTAKRIPLSPEARAVLGTDREELSGEEVIQHLLRAEVDLLWNGGIGTYVKASSETDLDVGDKANDRVRVDANELRCKVVGEGGNLGLTQAARVEFALRGGRLNTDAVDNSGGVDLSDHEVNLKILFAQMIQSGQTTAAERDVVLLEVDNDCVAKVLANNDQQCLGLSVGELRTVGRLRAWDDLIRFLSERLSFDRRVQLLPTRSVLTDRTAAGKGLMRPELARVQAFAKMWLFQELAEDKGSSVRVASEYLDAYFPPVVSERYPDAIAAHRLRHEIICTAWTNQIVDFSGAQLIPALYLEFDRPVADLCNAWSFAGAVLGVRDLRVALRGLEGVVPAAVLYEGYIRVEEALAAATRWLLTSYPATNLDEVLDHRDAISEWADGARPAILKTRLGGRLSAERRATTRWTTAGVPSALAAGLTGLDAMAHIFAIWRLSEESGLDPVQATNTYFATADVTGLAEIVCQIDAQNPLNHWEESAWASLRQDLTYTLFRLTLRVAQLLADSRTSGTGAVRNALDDRLHLRRVWELSRQIQAEGVQVPGVVVLAERLRARLR